MMRPDAGPCDGNFESSVRQIVGYTEILRDAVRLGLGLGYAFGRRPIRYHVPSDGISVNIDANSGDGQFHEDHVSQLACGFLMFFHFPVPPNGSSPHVERYQFVFQNSLVSTSPLGRSLEF